MILEVRSDWADGQLVEMHVQWQTPPIASTTHKQSSKKNLIRENVHKVKQTFGITVQKCYSHT